METMTCPNCHHTLAVTVLDRPPGSERALPTGRGVAAVGEFAKDIRGRFRFAELRAMYDDRRQEAGWPDMSDKAFARALRANGWSPWRTAEERGWEA